MLVASGQVHSVDEPISAMSQAAWGGLHSLGLVLFGLAQLLLAVALRGLDAGRLWPYGRALLASGGVAVVFVAYYFATAEAATLDSPGANDPLWAVATLVGLAMGLLQPGLSRLSLGLARFNVTCLAVWLLLIPAILLIGVISLGVYERLVGSVYLIWVSGLSIGLLRRASPPVAVSEA